MKKKLIFTMLICSVTLFACNSEGYENSETDRTYHYVSEEDGTSSEKEEEDTLYVDIEEAIVSGSVSMLVENGCTLQRGIDGEDVYSMPVGGENQSDFININFQEDIQVIIENYDGKEKEFAIGKKEDIKKNTFVYIFGEFVEDNSINADKIVIFRIVNMNGQG